jgi:hypothetical protein
MFNKHVIQSHWIPFLLHDFGSVIYRPLTPIHSCIPSFLISEHGPITQNYYRNFINWYMIYGDLGDDVLEGDVKDDLLDKLV